jgi:hypothetical protein
MRQFIRHLTSAPIRYSISNAPGDKREYLKNISQGGLCFLAPMHIAPESVIRIEIPVTKPIFRATAIVVWCRREGDEYAVGVKFKDAETEFILRIVEQLCHIERYREEALRNDGRTLTSEEAAMEWIDKYAADFPL